jgi:hypothetical protein
MWRSTLTGFAPGTSGGTVVAIWAAACDANPTKKTNIAHANFLIAMALSPTLN